MIKNWLDQFREDKKMNDLQPDSQVNIDLQGLWTQNLNIGNEEIWNLDRDQPFRPIFVENPSPSDSRFREDLIWLKFKNLDQSEHWKLEIEKRQRLDKKIRQTAAAALNSQKK